MMTSGDFDDHMWPHGCIMRFAHLNPGKEYDNPVLSVGFINDNPRGNMCIVVHTRECKENR